MLTWGYSDADSFTARDENGWVVARIGRTSGGEIVTSVCGHEVDRDSRSDWHDSETLGAKARLAEEWLPHVQIGLENEAEWGRNWYL
jgi:hypothetical protein